MSNLTAEQNRDLAEYKATHYAATTKEWIEDYEKRHSNDEDNASKQSNTEKPKQKNKQPVKKRAAAANKIASKKTKTDNANRAKPKADNKARPKKPDIKRAQKERDRKLKLRAENQKTIEKYDKQESNTELAAKSKQYEDASAYSVLRKMPRPIVEFCKSVIPGASQTDAVAAYILAMSGGKMQDLSHEISDKVRGLAENFKKSDPYFVEQSTIKQVSRKSDNIQNLLFSLLTLEAFYIGSARFGFGTGDKTMPQSLNDLSNIDFDSDFVEQIIEAVNDKSNVLLKEMRNRNGSNMRF